MVSGKDLLAALKAKLLEEVHEFLSSENDPAELADVLEVVDGLAQHMGRSMEDLLREKNLLLNLISAVSQQGTKSTG